MDFDTAIEESYAYDLWDQDKTMGCKCDPVYYGADCSLKKCKYGVDPLFYDDTDGVIYQTTVVHLGSLGTVASHIGGTFNMVFYDIFGEKYVTKPLDGRKMTDASNNGGLTAEKVKEALEALPNGVISKGQTDVTRVGSPAVTVSMQSAAGELTKTGGIGAGSSDSTNSQGVGIGTFHDYGPEFTITFSTNPGILKTIELDTAQITNTGVTDYWVANMRQGQFNSRYSQNLYPNEDLSGSVAANTLVKVGGQEFMVEDYSGQLGGSAGNFAYDGQAANGSPASTAFTDPSKSFRLTLSEPFLGTSIIPVLTDTGAVATSIGSAGVGGKPDTSQTAYTKAATSSPPPSPPPTPTASSPAATSSSPAAPSPRCRTSSRWPPPSRTSRFSTLSASSTSPRSAALTLPHSRSSAAVTTPPTRMSTKPLPTPPSSPPPATASAVAPPGSTRASSTAPPMPPAPTPSVLAPAPTPMRAPSPMPVPPLITLPPVPPLS